MIKYVILSLQISYTYACVYKCTQTHSYMHVHMYLRVGILHTLFTANI